MKPLWTLLKVVLALALVIPIGIIAAATAFGILAAMVGLAFFALRLAVLGLLVWGGFKLLGMLFGRREPAPVPPPVKELPPADPYYTAAMRDLDRELGTR